MIIDWGASNHHYIGGLNNIITMSESGGFPDKITLQELFSTKPNYIRSNMSFTVGGTVLIWKDNGLTEVLSGERRYILNDNVLTLV